MVMSEDGPYDSMYGVIGALLCFLLMFIIAAIPYFSYYICFVALIWALSFALNIKMLLFPALLYTIAAILFVVLSIQEQSNIDPRDYDPNSPNLRANTREKIIYGYRLFREDLKYELFYFFSKVASLFSHKHNRNGPQG